MSNVAIHAVEPPLIIPKEPFSAKVYRWGMWGIIAVILAWGYGPAEVYRFTGLFTDAQNMAEMAADFLQPSFRYIDIYIEQMILTIQMAFWGTFLAVIVSVPFALLSSNNIVPFWIVFPIRRLMDATRAINEIVFAVLFIVAVGLGPFAGIMAIFVHNVGVIAKLFSEVVETIDHRPVEGIKATGATRLQEIIFGVLPQVLPNWISLSLYRLETNVRSATVLGIVGAGGIGFVLLESIRSFEYSNTATIMLVIIIAVSVVDIISQQLRKIFL